MLSFAREGPKFPGSCRSPTQPSRSEKIRRHSSNRIGMSRKILLLSVSAGAGHLRAAQALEKAFHQVGEETGESFEVLNVDTLQYTNKIFRHLYSKAYIDLVNKL